MIMTDNNSLTNTNQIETRFGVIKVDLSKKIYFPQGVIGLEENKNFIIVDIPNQKDVDFKIMQSLDEMHTSFIVMPYNLENKWIEIEDINKTAQLFSIDPHNLLILFISTINNNEDNCTITLNLRAPIFINTEYNIAVQYVFSKSNYPIKYEL